MSSQPTRPDEPTVPCELCGEPTTMLGTKHCDGCWNLRAQVSRDPLGAAKVLRLLGYTVVRPSLDAVLTRMRDDMTAIIELAKR